jgi:hypothetical protein
LEQIKTVWLTPVNVCYSAHAVSAKFKLLCRTLKLWSKKPLQSIKTDCKL